MVPERFLGPGLVGGGADGLGEFLRTLGIGAREAQNLDQFGEMQEGLAVLLAPGGIEGRDRLGEAPEVDALAGSHGVAVHDRLEIAKPRHLVDDDQQIALKRFDTGDGVGDGDPQPQPALDVLDGLLRGDHEEVGLAACQDQGIETRLLGVGEQFRVVQEGELVGDGGEVAPALFLADLSLPLDRDMGEPAGKGLRGPDMFRKGLPLLRQHR